MKKGSSAPQIEFASWRRSRSAVRRLRENRSPWPEPFSAGSLPALAIRSRTSANSRSLRRRGALFCGAEAADLLHRAVERLRRQRHDLRRPHAGVALPVRGVVLVLPAQRLVERRAELFRVGRRLEEFHEPLMPWPHVRPRSGIDRRHVEVLHLRAGGPAGGRDRRLDVFDDQVFAERAENTAPAFDREDRLAGRSAPTSKSCTCAPAARQAAAIAISTSSTTRCSPKALRNCCVRPVTRRRCGRSEVNRTVSPTR